MGTMKNKMEAGDTSTSHLSSKKDLRTAKKKKKNDRNDPTRKAKTNKNPSFDLTSCSILTNEFLKSNNNDIVSSTTSIPLESYGFPYYRSYRNGGRSQDAVLVKDIGISCRLLNEKTSSYFSNDSIVESYLVKRLKTEYNDLTEITKKISSYTNDIIHNLILRDRKKKEQVENKFIKTQEKKIVTENKMKERLKMKSDAEIRFLYRKDVFCPFDKRKEFKSMSRLTKDQKNQRKLLSNKVRTFGSTNSSKTDCSSVVNNYLTMNNNNNNNNNNKRRSKILSPRIRRKI